MVRSERRTVEFSVRPNCTVVVRAPRDVPSGLMDRKVAGKGRWILGHLAYFRYYSPKKPPRRYIDGEEHLFQGAPCRLHFRKGPKESVESSPGLIAITFRDEPSPAAARRLLEKWYREKAHAYFSASLDRCWPMFQDDGYPKPFLAIRKMKRRWGSLSRDGKMTLNADLVRASPECVDYVVTHELCHLAHPDHGPFFHKQLGAKLPRWKELKRKLEADLA